MFKKLIISLVLFMFMTASAFGCMLVKGTAAWMFVNGGVQKVYAGSDGPVVLHEKQPTAEQLQKFDAQETVNEDWSDGVVVTDENEDINLLVHKKDLVGCDG